MSTSLGAFSISLAVKDLAKSRDFYAQLGFIPFHGSVERGMLIMRNGSAVIGLFQGAFDKNVMTFNPGWDQQAQPIDGFVHVDAWKTKLAELSPTTTGEKSFLLTDPDGNTILVDQHV
jgi:lactoylglutathione lyase